MKILLLLLLALNARAGVLNNAANAALGQIDLTNSSPDLPDGTGLTRPLSIIVDTTTHRLFVMDASHALIFNDYTTLTDGQRADGALGQPDMYSWVTQGPGPVALNFPYGGFVDAAGEAWIVDSNYNRVLRFTPPFATGMSPDLVLGQTTLNAGNHAAPGAATLYQPQGAAMDPAGRIWVSDTNNHRVLRYSPPFATGMSADLVLGQPDFISGNPNGGGAVAANTLNYPGPLTFDAAGDLWICDSFNHRLLRYNAPIAGGANASIVLGQADFASGLMNAGVGTGANTLASPAGIAVDAAGDVWAGDTSNNRVVRYAVPISSGMNATLVLGQSNLTTRTANVGGAVAANTLNQPAGLALDAAGALWVADTNNHRALRFLPAFATGMNASRVLGQPDYVHNTDDLVNARGLHNPWFVVVDSTHNRAFVADAGNNRVLWWNDAATLTTGKPADGVIGQQDFNSNSSPAITAKSLSYPLGMAVDAAGALWVADDIDSRVLRFSPPFTTGMSADLALGQAGFGAGGVASPPTAASLNVPYDVAIDSTGAVFVADYGNGRVLRYRAPFATGMSADLVLGQPGFGATVTSPLSASLMSGPAGLAIGHDGAVWAADAGANRVLRFPVALATGEAADLVLGQPDFVSNGSPGTPNARGLAFPQGIAVDAAGDVWVGDTFNNRAVMYGVPLSSGMAAALVIGQPDFFSNDAAFGPSGLNEPSGFFVDSGNELWIADNANSRVLKFTGPNVLDPIGTSSSQTVKLEGAVNTFSLDVPAGAFVQNVSMAMSFPAAVPAPQSGIRCSSIAVVITNDMGLQPLKPLTLTMTYRDIDVSGLDATKLGVAYYNPASGLWVTVPSSVDPVAHTVTGHLPHLTLFAVVQVAAAADLSTAYAYPNPYKPGSGGVFDDSAFGPGIVFAGLTGRVRIRVATIAGEEVADFTAEDGSGRAVWNARNGRGETVASGVYLYVISDLNDTSRRRTGRFAIIR
ncbi:MAG: NHL repeat-containing protein [Elusimicrobiota bacterium]